MLTEFEVRRRVRDICASGESSVQKARLLLRIGRVLKRQLRSLDVARRAAASSDRNGKALLGRMTRSTRSLREEVRTEANRLLSPSSGVRLY